jgi:hypothetical protein
MKIKIFEVLAIAALLPCLFIAGTAGATGSTNVINSADEASLRAAIRIGGWVGFNVSGTITITNTICITNNVFLDGRDVAMTISGGNAVRLFYVAPGATFGVTNLTLANGSCILVTNTTGTNADGGAIYNNGGAVTLVDCTLTNNSAQALINFGTARGGAVFNNGGSVALCQSTIVNSLALGGGPNCPAPGPTNYDGPQTTITDTGLGGAIYNASGAVTITGCNINNSVCESVIESGMGNYGTGLAMGGAVFQASGSLLIANSIFKTNQVVGGASFGDGTGTGSPAYGGALAVTEGSLSIDHCVFGMNQAIGGVAGDGNVIPAGSGGVACGGAIFCSAESASTDSSYFGNRAIAGSGDYAAASGGGGGIYNAGNLELDGCSIYSNDAQGGAGMPFNEGFSSTGGDGQGGGVFNTAQLVITNCTIALNSCTAGSGSSPFFGLPGGANGNALGGGAYNAGGTLFMMNVTVASNNCVAQGDNPTNGLTAGIQVANSGTLSLLNSILAYSGTNSNAYGTITDDGYNICSDGSATLSSGTSFNSLDPQLAPLADYGGPTLCMALLPASPAIDHGDPADFPTTDQRGYFRPAGAGPDIGAYESSSFPLVIPTLAITGTASNVLVSFTAAMPTAYYLQASTNLLIWTNVGTNGPFASTTNVTVSVNQQGLNPCYFRLRMQ